MTQLVSGCARGLTCPGSIPAVSVVRLLARLGGIAPARDLAAAGVGAGLLRIAWQNGEIVRFRKGWYGLPSLAPDIIAASRVGGVVACLSAARTHGLWVPEDDELHVLVPRTASRLRQPDDHRRRLSGGVRVHWNGPPRSPYELVEPIEHAVERIAGCRGVRPAFVVLESALNRRRLPDAAVDRLRRLDPLFADASERSDSGIESLLKLALLDAGIAFRQQVAVEGCGIADFLIGRRLVVETDGRQFHDPLRDRQRDARFSIAGYRTLRFLSSQVVREMDEVMASVRAAIARGDHQS